MNEIWMAMGEGDTIISQTFENLIIQGEDFSRREFIGVTFTKCKLLDCIFHGCYFHQCMFLDCDISNSQFTNAYFNNCQIIGSKAVGVEMHESILKEVSIRTSVFRYSNFSVNKWNTVMVKECDFSEAAIGETKLIKVIIEDTNMTSADIFKTSIKGIDVSSCDIDGIIMSENFQELKGAKINVFQAAKIIAMLGIEVVD